MDENKYSWVVVLIFVLFVGFAAFKVYERETTIKVVYGYACPDKNSTKCYKVKVDVEDPVCHGEDGCDPAVLNGFEIGKGYVACEDYDNTHCNYFSCLDEEGKNWTVNITEEAKVKK